MNRKASAVWQGGLKEGRGTISSESGVLQDTTYGFRTRFESSPGTNPEELIAAAHAACFSMALSKELEDAGLKPNRITTQATTSLEKQGAGWAVTRVHLDVTISAAEAEQSSIQKAATSAKTNCPISKLLNAEITMEARLEK